MLGRLGPVVPAMGLGDLARSREGMPRGPHAVAVRVGLWPSAPGQVPAARTRLEDLRRRLVRAFQGAVPRGASRRPPAAAAGEEQSPASVQSIVAGLRAELVSAPWRRWDGPRLRPLGGLPAADCVAHSRDCETRGASQGGRQ